MLKIWMMDLQRQNQIENLRQANDDLEPQEKQVEY